MRKQHFGIFVFQKLLIVTVTDYAADCFIECSLMLRISEAIDKDKIRVSVNGSDTMKIEQILPFVLLLRFSYLSLFLCDSLITSPCAIDRSIKGVYLLMTSGYLSHNASSDSSVIIAHFSVPVKPLYSYRRLMSLQSCANNSSCSFTVSFFISVISLNLEFLIYKVEIKNSGDHGYLHTNACHTVIDIKLPFRLTKAKRAAQKKQL